MKRAACTIVSLNYLPYARVLCDSFLKFHPDYKFYVLLVDRLPKDFDTAAERFEVIPVENLNINNFESVAFKFGILELNTNVKPTFLKTLLDQGISQLIYFDPDILIYSSLDFIYEALNTHGILLTPHCLSPNDGAPYAETLLLVDGVFNLGFIAVSKAEETIRFLEWWERGCLALGYNERWSGLFVDQKWINLVPCYFDTSSIIKHPGCNVAYWNLHERKLTKPNGAWTVNQDAFLLFFHFSGMSVDSGTMISKHTDQFDLVSRPELRELFGGYRELLIRHGIHDASTHRYAFGEFDNGVPVSKFLRGAFAASLDRFGSTNPFASSGPFYQWAKKNRFLPLTASIRTYSRKDYDKSDYRVRIIHALLRLLLRVVGTERYTVLMQYLEFASVLRNQKDVLHEI